MSNPRHKRIGRGRLTKWETNYGRDAYSVVFNAFLLSGRNLLAAEAAAGVGHHVALSVVGTDRLLASGYFRAKWPKKTISIVGIS